MWALSDSSCGGSPAAVAAAAAVVGVAEVVCGELALGTVMWMRARKRTLTATALVAPPHEQRRVGEAD
jgi:hypothetical protein